MTTKLNCGKNISPYKFSTGYFRVCKMREATELEIHAVAQLYFSRVAEYMCLGEVVNDALTNPLSILGE